MRPPKARTIGCIPECRRFRPFRETGENRAMRNDSGADSITICLDMLEAMRLVDAEGMTQEEAARRMEISAPTLCRILGQGRRLAALALTTGKTINLEGGNIMCGDTMQGRHGHRCCRRHGKQAECAAQASGEMCSHGGMGRGRGKGHGNHGGQGRCARSIAGDDNTNAANNGCRSCQEPLER